METMTMTIPVKDLYLAANPNRNKPENVINGERLETLITGGIFNPGDLVSLHHDIFFDDVILYTDLDNKTDSMLVRDVDYELEEEDSIATDQSGWRCYQKVKILRAQEGIYADYVVYGDFIDCNIFNQQISLSKGARADITSLQNRITSAEGKISNHEPRITDNEVSIRANLAKINLNASEIERADREIKELQNKATRAQAELFLQEDGQEVKTLEKIRGEIARVAGKIESIKEENAERARLIEELQGDLTLLQSQLQPIMPIEFCYTQLKGTSEPGTLWPSFQWEKGIENSEFSIWKRTG